MYGRPKSRFIEILFVGLSAKPGGHGGPTRETREKEQLNCACCTCTLEKDCVPSELNITCLYFLVEVFIKAMNVLVVSLKVSSVL